MMKMKLSKAQLAKLKKDLVKAKNKAKVEFAKAKKDLVKAEKDVSRYIEKNPKKAAAIAAGAGVALGAVLGALMRRRK